MPEHTAYMRFATDRNGQVWIASAQGLLQWDQGSWMRISATDGLRADALRTVMERMKIVVEPSAVVPLAVLLNGPLGLAGKRVGIILSGGNVDVSNLPI